MEECLATIKDKSMTFIRNHVDSIPQTPFYLHIALTSPHTPHLPPPKWAGSSDGLTREDFIAYTDWIIGEIVTLLDTLKITDQTLLFFASDNGARDDIFTSQSTHTPHLYYKGQKADIYEAGHRVPVIVRWPGVVYPATQSTHTICLTDFMATAAAVVGFPLPQNTAEDSYSLLPVLLGKSADSLREGTVHHSSDGTFAIRVGDWKLTDGNMGSGGFTKPKVVAGPGTLYNIADDPSETTDLYSSNPDIVAKLRNLLNTYKSSGRSTSPNRNDAFWDKTSLVQKKHVLPATGHHAELFDLKGRKLAPIKEFMGKITLKELQLLPGLYLIRFDNGLARTVYLPIEACTR
jgi:arylsulfatase A-like enzyme